MHAKLTLVALLCAILTSIGAAQHTTPAITNPHPWKTNSTTTPGKNHTTIPTLTLPPPHSNETTATATATLGSNSTLQTFTPTQTKDQPSASHSSAAAVANMVVERGSLPAGIAAMVAFGMAFL